MHKSMSLKHKPSSKPLHIYAKQLFFNRELYRSVVVLRLRVHVGTVLDLRTTPSQNCDAEPCTGGERGGRGEHDLSVRIRRCAAHPRLRLQRYPTRGLISNRSTIYFDFDLTFIFKFTISRLIQSQVYF